MSISFTNSTGNSISEGFILQEKYEINQQLGEGSFGKVFLCTEISSNKKYAIKVEQKINKKFSMLTKEIKVMNLLKNEQGFPKLHSHGFILS